jgi:hypothetical protein
VLTVAGFGLHWTQNPHSLWDSQPAPSMEKLFAAQQPSNLPSLQRTITADYLPFTEPIYCLCLMWWDDVCNGMALDADREWDFPRLPFVEKRAISIFQPCSAGRARVRSPMSACRVYKFDECLGRETVAHLKSFLAFP